MPRRPPLRPLPAALVLAALLLPMAAARAEPAHVHGQVTLELAIEPRSISLRLDAPQDSLLGHERTPRSAAERQAAAAVLQRLQDGAALFGLPAEAGCRAAGTPEVVAPRLQPGAAAAAGAHADIEASYRFDCARTDGLRALDLGGLLDAFPRIQRIDAQVAGPASQHKTTLTRPARRLAWGR